MSATKKELIIKAIDELFGDTSVPPETTLDQLQEIQSDAESKIYAIEGDLKRKQKDEQHADSNRRKA